MKSYKKMEEKTKMVHIIIVQEILLSLWSNFGKLKQIVGV
jgi:hypothetical protein